MMIRSALAVALTVLPLPALAQAAPPAATPAPEKEAAPAPAAAKPTQDLDTAFKFFAGAWKCDTTLAANSLGAGSPEVTAKATVKVTREYGGYFYRAEYDIKKSKTMPGFHGTIFLGYHPTARVYSFNAVDSAGTSELATSPGFEGDTITFTGSAYVNGQAVKVRESLTKRGAKEVDHKLELDLGKGPTTASVDACTR